jgi:hypothetical protein
MLRTTLKLICNTLYGKICDPKNLSESEENLLSKIKEIQLKKFN